MDLVKNHLMSAVRGEVDEMREKIIRLEEGMARLQVENDILREHVSREVNINIKYLLTHYIIKKLLINRKQTY